MIKQKDLQIYYSVNRYNKVNELLLIDSSTMSFDQIHKLADHLPFSNGNICRGWEEENLHIIYARLLKRGFESPEVEESVRSQFYEVEGMKDFLDQVYW